MQYNFDLHNERRGTDCYNYDGHPTDDPDVIPLQAADMDFQTLPEVISALRSVIDRGVYGYPIDPTDYCESVRGWFSARHGWQADAEWIVSCRNVVSATALLLCLNTSPGDAVMTFTPVYSPFVSVIRKNGREAVECPLVLANGKWQINFDLFETLMVQKKVKMLLLCNPHNPVGRVWTHAELAYIATFCAQHGVFVISDEIHCDFVFYGHRHIPFLSLAASCTSANKTFNLALLENANIFIPDKANRDAFWAAQSASFVEGGSYLGKLACATAYRLGADWADQLISYLENNLTAAVDFLHRELSELPVMLPEGTYLLWLDCRTLGMEPQQLSDFLLQRAKLRLINGDGYGTGGSGFMRINCARPHAEVMEALYRLQNSIIFR